MQDGTIYWNNSSRLMRESVLELIDEFIKPKTGLLTKQAKAMIKRNWHILTLEECKILKSHGIKPFFN